MPDITVTDRPPRAMKKPPKVQGRLRQALDAMIWEGMTYDQAAQSVGFTVASMRKAMQRSHVLAYIRNERDVLRATISPRNIHRLVDIRDAGDNMPAVQAIKLLEQMDDSTNTRAGSSLSQVPGFTIVLQQIVAGEPMGHVISVDATNKPAISTGSVPLVGERRSGDESV